MHQKGLKMSGALQFVAPHFMFPVSVKSVQSIIVFLQASRHCNTDMQQSQSAAALKHILSIVERSITSLTMYQTEIMCQSVSINLEHDSGDD
jgi:hypothetical protein